MRKITAFEAGWLAACAVVAVIAIAKYFLGEI